MAEQTNLIKEPKNYLDPIVYHDPSIKADLIVKKYTPQKTDVENNLWGNNKHAANERTEGVTIPIIKVNNITIDFQNILYFKIESKNFSPTILLTIIDFDNLIKFKDIPGMNNVITVYIGSNMNAPYKPIKLNFYITNVSTSNNKITYTGVYKLFALKNSQLKAIVHPGCTSCSTNSSNELNTFEYLHDIALDCGLGFAATDKCKEIQDRLPRLMISQNYEDFIKQQIEFGGLDENSIFDCWIDFYNYLVLVNVSWVFNENNDPNVLAIFAEEGFNNNNEEDETPKNQECIRTIHNSNRLGFSNLSFDSYEDIVKNGSLMDKGNLKTVYYMVPDGNNGTNRINTFQVQTIEDSIDGNHIEDYEIKKTSSFVFDFNKYNVNKQKIIRNDFFEKRRSKILKVKMIKPNYGLTRGILVNMMMFEYDSTIKRDILFEHENLNSENENDKMPDANINDDIFTVGDIIENTGVGLPNNAKNGQYYIDGVEIIYDSKLQKLDQYLYLIKKGKHKNYTNKYTHPKYKINNINNV